MEDIIKILKKDVKRLQENPEYFDDTAKYSLLINMENIMNEIEKKETVFDDGVFKKF